MCNWWAELRPGRASFKPVAMVLIKRFLGGFLPLEILTYLSGMGLFCFVLSSSLGDSETEIGGTWTPQWRTLAQMNF